MGGEEAQALVAEAGVGVEGAELGRLRLLLMQLVELLPRLLVQLQAPIQSPSIHITRPSPPPPFPDAA